MNLLNKCRLEKSYVESVVSVEDMRFQLWVVEYPLPDKVWISHERFSNKKKSFNHQLTVRQTIYIHLSTQSHMCAWIYPSCNRLVGRVHGGKVASLKEDQRRETDNHNHSHLHPVFKSPVDQKCMSLDCGRTWLYLQRGKIQNCWYST